MRKEAWIRNKGGGEYSGATTTTPARNGVGAFATSVLDTRICGVATGTASGGVMRSVLDGMIRQDECTGCPGIRWHPPLAQQLSGDMGCKSCDQQAKLPESSKRAESTGRIA